VQGVEEADQVIAGAGIVVGARGSEGCALDAGRGRSPFGGRDRFRVGVEAVKARRPTEASVDEISWQVGCEEPAFFRRLFRRVTGLAPGAYRRRFRIPDFARTRRNA
jgi:AraC-like DNA-binding protein